MYLYLKIFRLDPKELHYVFVFRLNPKELLNHAYLCGVSIPVYKKVRKYHNISTILGRHYI